MFFFTIPKNLSNETKASQVLLKENKLSELKTLTLVKKCRFRETSHGTNQCKKQGILQKLYRVF